MSEDVMPKHAGGRPLKFQAVKDLTDIADAYFDNTPEEEWTVSGLALALDCGVELLRDYKERDEFSSSIKRYYLKVHNAYEKDLRRKGRSGDIFALKNFGWRDQQDIDHTSKGKELPQPILGGLSISDLRNNDSDQEASETPQED